MTKRIQHLLLPLLFILPVLAHAKKIKGEKTIYMFGVSVSIKDSTACISTPQPVSGAQLSKKGGMLVDRTAYTQQFKAYVESTYSGSHTCAIFFSTSPKAIEKQWNKVHARKTKEKEVKLQQVSLDEFRFTSPSAQKAAGTTPKEEPAS